MAIDPKPSFTTAQAAAQITRDGYGWVTTYGTPTTVTYGLRASVPGASYGYGDGAPPNTARVDLAQMGAIEIALGLWSDVANVAFKRIGTTPYGSPGYTDAASMLFATYAARDGAEAYAYLPAGPDRSAASPEGDVWLNRGYGDAFAYETGAYAWMATLHEIGHALGLGHPGDYNGGRPTYEADAEYVQDTWQYTIMSYFEEFYTGADYALDGGGAAYPSTPQLDDVAAMQRIYGANWSTRSGDTCYGFASNADREVFRLNSAKDHRTFTIWDGGGYDLLNFSLYAQDAVINLNAETFSSVGGLVHNVAIAANVTLEAAYGGSGRDRITGNAVANDLRGGAGDDTLAGLGGNDRLDGGGGYDVARFVGSADQYAIYRRAEGFWVADGVGGRDGIDLVAGAEALAFAPGWVTSIDLGWLATHSGTVVADAPGMTASAGTRAGVADWFTSRSYLGDVGVTGYAVHDSWAGGGSLVTPWGQAISAGTWTYLSAQDFGGLTYAPSSSGGTDDISVYAWFSDGRTSNVATTAVSNVNAAPTLAAGHQTVELDGAGRVQALAGLLTWTDTPDDAIRTVMVQAADGRVVLADGRVLPNGSWSYITPDEFAGASYVSGGHHGSVWAAVFDGAGGYSNFVPILMTGGDTTHSTSTPFAVAPGGSFAGTIGHGDDGDAIATHLAPGVYTFALDGAGSGRGTLDDPYLRLYDAGLHALAQDDDSGPGGDARFTFEITAAGTYYLEALAADAGTGSYVLHVDSGFV